MVYPYHNFKILFDESLLDGKLTEKPPNIEEQHETDYRSKLFS